MFKVLLIGATIALLYLVQFSLQSEIHTVLLVVIAVGLIYWLNKIRKKNVFTRRRFSERPLIPIDGFEIQTTLDIDTPLECLQHDGLRYGQSFRLKTAPPLPHNEHCQCKVFHLSYSSCEVFEGALRKNSSRASAIGTLPFKEAHTLKEMLKNLESQVPVNFEAYCEQFDLGFISEEQRMKIVGLVRRKFDQIQGSNNSSSLKKIYQE